MQCMVCLVYYLGCLVVNINAHLLSNEASLNVTSSFRGQLPGFDEYIFPQLQTCTALVLSADCTEGSCSSNLVIFNNFLVFNYPFNF